MEKMNIREIRIGNIIEYLTVQNPDTWDQILVSPVTFGRLSMESTRFRGIDLTPEWLEKFGFTGNANEGFGFNAVELNYITTDDHFEFEYCTPDGPWMLVSVKHVHTLQNLFYILTGQELTQI